MDPRGFASTGPGTSIVDLSTELLCLVIDHLPLSSHFDFACTCKRLAAASRYILRRHQKAHKQFCTASDLDPSTVPLLLQSAFGEDPIPAWHVRSFEIWRDRTAWDEWTTYSLLTPPISGWDNGVSDLDILGFQPLLGKVSGYLEWFDDYIPDSTNVVGIDRDKALSQVETGHDGLLKALLFANCPRLRDLKFLTRSRAKGSTLFWLDHFISSSNGPWALHHRQIKKNQSQGESDTTSECTSGRHEPMSGTHDEQPELFQEEYQSETESDFDREWEIAYANWMEEQTIQEMANMEICEENQVCEQDLEPDRVQDDETGSIDGARSDADNLEHWPVGFASLRSVAIGVASDTWMDDDEYPCSMQLVAHLLHLPDIDTLCFRGLRCDGEDHFDEHADDSSASSSDWDDEFLPERSSSVKHLFLESLGYELDGEFLVWLCHAPRKLLTAAIRNSVSDVDVFHKARSFVRYLAKSQGSSLQSLMWYGFDRHPTISDEYSVIDIEEFKGLHTLKQVSFNVYDLAAGACNFPLTWGDTPAEYDSHDDFYVQYAADAFPASIECLILWGDASSAEYSDKAGETVLLERAIIKMIEDGCHKNLRTIFVEDVERATDHGKGLASFAKAVAVGKAAGVDVYTRTNRPAQHAIAFPERVEKYNLKTGTYPDGRPSDWVFNCYTGCREPPQDDVFNACKP